MKTKRMGSAGPDVSVIGYGAWEAGGMAWGANPPDEQTIAAMHAGFDDGIDWVDTAEVYGGGRSEELVGQAVQDRPDVKVFTKVAPEGAGTGFAPEQVREACEKSLRRLQRDHIDLYQLHWPDGSVPIEQTWEAVAALAEEGLISHAGVSNFDRALIERCEKIRHVDCLQPHYSMLHRKGESDLFPFCEANGTGIIAYGSLAYGLLSGRFDESTTFGDDDWRSGKHGMQGYYEHLFKPGVFERRVATVERLRAVSDRLKVTVGQLALAWVAAQGPVTGAIVGSRSPEHVRENAAAGAVTLEAGDLEEVASILEEAEPA